MFYTLNHCERVLVGVEGGSWEALLGAGINDWGGLSPLTRDFVNPEKPWPHLAALEKATAAAGKVLVPRWVLLPSFFGFFWPPGVHHRRLQTAALQLKHYKVAKLCM